MSDYFKKHALANITGRGLAKIAPLVSLPIMSLSLGLEQFALLAFFASITHFSFLFYSGLSLSANREIATLEAIQKYKNLAISSKVALLEIIFFLISLTITLLIFLTSKNLSGFLFEDVDGATNVIQVCCVALFFYGPILFYENCITGLLDFIYLSKINVFFESTRWIGGAFLVYFLDEDLSFFFITYAIVSCMQTVIMRYRVQSKVGMYYKLKNFRVGIIEVWEYYYGVFLNTLLTTVLTQVDRLAMFTLLKSSDVGIYYIAHTLARSIYVITFPISNLLFPYARKTLLSQSKDKFIHIYDQALLYFSIALVPIAVTLFMQANNILQLYLPTEQIGYMEITVLQCITISTFFFALTELQKAPLVATGKNSRLSKVYALVILIGGPTLYLLTQHYRIYGLLIGGTLLSVTCFVFVTMLLQIATNPQSTFKILCQNVGVTLLVVLVFNVCLKLLLYLFDKNLNLWFPIIATGVLSVLSAILATAKTRKILRDYLRK